MNEMTLSSRDRIRNSSPGGLKPSSLLLVLWIVNSYCCLSWGICTIWSQGDMFSGELKLHINEQVQ